MQKSYHAPNPGENRPWFLIDAKDQVLGRLAVVVANKLRAKDLPTFDPSVDAGAFVVVTNAAQVKLTGNKEEQKEYQRYSGFRGGLKEFTAAEMRAMHPDRMILEAVWGMPHRLGDILRWGKNDYRKATSAGHEDNNMRYFLFGDPAMRPAFAPLKIKVESINGQQLSEDNKPEFKARQTLTFAGKVTDSKGNKVDFNGPVIATLYDCEQSVLSHGYGDGGEEYAYLDRPNKLAVKVDTVKNGDFSFKVTVPSEILATFDNYSPSLINLYAYDNSQTSNVKFNGGSREAMGSNSQFYIYGVVCTDGTSEAPTYDQLKDMQISGTPVDVTYNVREAGSRSGKTAGGYKGKFIITSLDLDAQAGDDSKYSIQLENCGKVEKQTTGLQETAVMGLSADEGN